MILYFDSYITDIPLPGRSRDLLKEDIRKNVTSYKMSSRIEIAKYVLASYALYPWSHVLIRYELDNAEFYKAFDAYIFSLFPRAKIIHRRSDSQKEYIKSLNILKKWNDPWVFYAPNNDHPIISADTEIVKYLDQLIALGNKYQKNHKFVSIMYSHFSEFLNLSISGTPQYELYGKNSKILQDGKIARVYLVPGGDFSSVQITSIKLLNLWFNSADLGSKRVIRAEDTLNSVKIKDQIIIAPKKIICAHFDGYEHLLKRPNEITNDQIPPLFIPKGFFENKIKIAYGFNRYRDGWVNINPCVQKYSFRDKKFGTDLKLSSEQIPLFWKSHIEKIVVNPKLRQSQVNKCVFKQQRVLENPWLLQSKGININMLKYLIRFRQFKLKRQIRTILGRLKRNLI